MPICARKNSSQFSNGQVTQRSNSSILLCLVMLVILIWWQDLNIGLLKAEHPPCQTEVPDLQTLWSVNWIFTSSKLGSWITSLPKIGPSCPPPILDPMDMSHKHYGPKCPMGGGAEVGGICVSASPPPLGAGASWDSVPMDWETHGNEGPSLQMPHGCRKGVFSLSPHLESFQSLIYEA